MKRLVLLLLIFLLLPISNAVATPCNGDFDCDGDCDAEDVTTFLQDFGRGQYFNPCEPCRYIDVPKTGLTQCYDHAGNPRDCQGTGEDGEYQMGFAPPTDRLTDNADGTVTDNFTGLMWMQDTQYFGTTMNWQNALDACEGLDLAGHSDWRLPHVNELYSLIDYGQDPIHLPQDHPFLNITLDYYWTSTTTNYRLDVAWCNSFVGGIIVSSADKYVADRFPAWCVRGGR